jgi:hypothetical protein
MARADLNQEGRAPTDEGNTAIGTDALEDDAYIKRVWAWFKEADTKEHDIREEERDDHAVYAGHQWKEQNLNELVEQKRPALTINYTLPIINAVTGEERLNRQEIKVYGRDEGDEGGADVMSETIRYIMDSCNGEYALSRSFRNCAIGGRGWVGVSFSYDEDPQGKISVDKVDPWEIYLDPTSRKEDATDARYLIREKWMTEDEIDANWPGKLEELKATTEANREEGYGEESTPIGDAYRGKGDTKIYDSEKGTWRVLEVLHYEMVAGAIAINPDTGAIEELTEDELEALIEDTEHKKIMHAQAMETMHTAELTGAMPEEDAFMAVQSPPPDDIQHAKKPIKIFHQGFVAGDVVLERGPNPLRRLKMFHYIPCMGLWDDENENWFGLVRQIKDPQRQHNVEQSAILHWTQVSPKSGWIGPRGSFVDRKRWEDKSANAGFIGEYNPSRGKPERINPPSIPRHMVELGPARLQSMRDIAGVNMDMMASSQKDSAGVVIEMRRKQAITVLQTLFDNLRLTRRILGEVLIAFIQEYMADDRIIRIVGSGKANYLPIAKEIGFGNYDAVIEDAQDTPTDRLQAMHILQTTLPMLLKAGIPIPPDFVDLLPIPKDLKEKWKNHIQMMMGMPPEGSQQGPPQPGLNPDSGGQPQ